MRGFPWTFMFHITTWSPAEYARNPETQARWANELLFLFHQKGSEALLDLGCGDGKITAALAQAVPHARAVGITSNELGRPGWMRFP